MKKNGFTLVELLAVITLVALLTTVIITAVSSSYKNMRKDLNESQVNLIYSATDTYVQRYKNAYPEEEGSEYCILLEDLVMEGLLEDNLKDAMENKNIDLSLGIKVTVDSKKSYHFELDTKESICTK